MLDRTHRIRTKEFPDFRAPGKIFNGAVLRIKYIPSAATMKVAVIVGKKSYRTNVERNKFRRRIYSALGAQLNKLDMKGGVILVSPIKKVEDIQWSGILADIESYVSH